MSILQDELWRFILEIGVRGPNPSLTYKELCCLAMTSRRFLRLASEDSLWTCILSSDFPPSSPSSSSSSALASSPARSIYQIRFEKDRDRKRATHRRAVLRKESQIAVHMMKLSNIEATLAMEDDRLKDVTAELSDLHKIKQTSVALNVWQPQIIRGQQKCMVEQCTVPVEFRIRNLEMDLKVCKTQISMLRKSYEEERRRLDASKQELESIKYNPLRDYEIRESSMRRKKLRRLTES
ncbi:hypothetical protein SAY87_001363 [Trapa incisa]|uniref:F-box protein SKIP24 n=2 Tax=Trapa TaxID=22665 RepID=A0AAN7LQY7_TRANT|nr:hypothetical protein SAY87_001363 [Trapa incisa]KAK4789924.1 hypothetical protein SAY86_017228 [Trapa natans]